MLDLINFRWGSKPVEAPKALKGRGVHSPIGEESVEEDVSPSSEFFLIFELKMVRFGALWVLFFTVRLPVSHTTADTVIKVTFLSHPPVFVLLTLTFGGNPPLPFHPLSSPLEVGSFRSLPFPCRPSPSLLPLRSSPPLQLEGLGERISSPSGYRQSPAAKRVPF